MVADNEGPLDDPIAERLRLQKLMEDSDLKNAEELFGDKGEQAGNVVGCWGGKEVWGRRRVRMRPGASAAPGAASRARQGPQAARMVRKPLGPWPHLTCPRDGAGAGGL